MRLPFLDRDQELSRIRKAISALEASLVILYGRRRCGKSRLLQEALQGHRVAYYVGDEREGNLQRRSLAKAAAALIPGFDGVEYPDWEALLDRWWREAPTGAVLTLDEFPYLSMASPELPSLLQKKVDAPPARPLHLIICGSSQRMMHGIILDSKAPLYGRAREVLKIEPLAPGWIGKAFPAMSDPALLEAYSVWGGIPRYWELANEFKTTPEAVLRLALDPLGVLLDEPQRLLLDDLREITQASSVLSLIGEGCHKISEIAGRLGRPATSLSRPLGRLLDLGLVERETPFGGDERNTKRSRYHIADPFLCFWYRFVNPRRVKIESRQFSILEGELKEYLPTQLGEIWEQLARRSVSRLTIAGQRWRPGSRWWGAGTNREPLELDIVALSEDGSTLLAGEAKSRLGPQDWIRERSRLTSKIERFPLAQGREVLPCIWYAAGERPPRGVLAVGLRKVLTGLR